MGPIATKDAVVASVLVKASGFHFTSKISATASHFAMQAYMSAHIHAIVIYTPKSLDFLLNLLVVTLFKGNLHLLFQAAGCQYRVSTHPFRCWSYRLQS